MNHQDDKQRIIQTWDEICEFYDYERYWGPELTTRVNESWERELSHLLPSKTAKILDVGCGTGFLTIKLANMGYDVSGVDLSVGMRKICARKANEQNLWVELFHGDAESLPFPDNSYDCIVSRWLLWTLLHPDIAVTEWTRVLKPGGIVLAFDAIPMSSKSELSFPRTRKIISNCLLSLMQRRNMWKEGYPKEIDNLLPLNYHKDHAFENQVKLFTQDSFESVNVYPLKDLDKLSIDCWNHMSWPYRFAWKGGSTNLCIQAMVKVR